MSKFAKIKVKRDMLIDSEDIKSQFTENLQKLMEYIISRFSGFPLIFWDKKEFEEKLGIPFLPEGTGCCFKDKDKLVIALKELDSIFLQEPIIAHELGHFWLESHGFPRRQQGPFKTKDEEDRYNICFRPLLEIMEHAIYYSWLKVNYSFDLYSVGDKRLVNFLRNELASLCNKYLANKHEGEKVTLILSYIKFNVEADNRYWQDRLEKAYSKGILAEIRHTAQQVLPIIRSLSNQEPDSKCFKEKYLKVLGNIGIDKQFWPEYMRF